MCYAISGKRCYHHLFGWCTVKTAAIKIPPFHLPSVLISDLHIFTWKKKQKPVRMQNNSFAIILCTLEIPIWWKSHSFVHFKVYLVQFNFRIKSNFHTKYYAYLSNEYINEMVQLFFDFQWKLHRMRWAPIFGLRHLNGQTSN